MRTICAVVGGYNLIFKPRKLGQGFWFCHVSWVTLGYLVNLYEPQFLRSKIRTVTVSQGCYTDAKGYESRA